MLFLFRGHHTPLIRAAVGVLLIVVGLILHVSAILIAIGAVLLIWGGIGALTSYQARQRLAGKNGDAP
jgi:hypothetical protein